MLVPFLGQPDITPCDFSLWGYAKDCVHRTLAPNINNFDRISAPVAAVGVDVLQHTWLELEYHFDIVRMTDGSHVGCV
jgi:hypothetical protein